MKWLNGDRKKIVLMRFIATLLLCRNLARADFILGEPVNLGPLVNSASHEYSPSISADGLSLYFHAKNRPGGYGDTDIWVATRPTIEEPWNEAMNLGPVINSTYKENSPCISNDNQELYFNSNLPGGNGVFMSRRATQDDFWGEPISIVDFSAGSGLSLSSDGLELYFSEYARPGGYGNHDIWVSKRTSREAPWGIPQVLPSPPNTAGREDQPEISADGLALFFGSGELGGNRNIYVSTRATKEDAWGPATNIGPSFSGGFIEEMHPSVWDEGLELYFTSSRQPNGDLPTGLWAQTDIWKASIIPIVDLNADGIVDAEDMCIMVDNWGTDNKLCDIGPMPWGDGIVDVEDLIVLAEHLFEEFPPVESGQ